MFTTSGTHFQLIRIPLSTLQTLVWCKCRCGVVRGLCHTTIVCNAVQCGGQCARGLNPCRPGPAKPTTLQRTVNVVIILCNLAGVRIPTTLHHTRVVGVWWPRINRVLNIFIIKKRVCYRCPRVADTNR